MWHVAHSTATKVAKGEDVISISPLLESVPETWLYLVCDGHIGKEAAKYVAANFQRILCSKLDWFAELPDPASGQDMGPFAELVRRVVCETFAELDNGLYVELQATAAKSNRQASGAAVTAVVVLGPLLTVANVGDCHAVLDTGSFRVQLTHSHRLAENATEHTRLRTAGCHVAPLAFHCKGPAKIGEDGIGPLRVWPGGLCVSRSVGDYDSGPSVSPLPHIKQVLMPEDGCRVLLASDGLWDVLSFRKALSIIRAHPIWSTAAELVRIASQNQRVIDDTSVVVVDLLPEKSVPFRVIAAKRQAAAAAAEASQRTSPRSSASGAKPPSTPGGLAALFACFRGGPQLDSTAFAPDLSVHADPGIPILYADVDGLYAYPELSRSLRRNRHMSKLPISQHGSTKLGGVACALAPEAEAIMHADAGLGPRLQAVKAISVSPLGFGADSLGYTESRSSGGTPFGASHAYGKQSASQQPGLGLQDGPRNVSEIGIGGVAGCGAAPAANKRSAVFAALQRFSSGAVPQATRLS